MLCFLCLHQLLRKHVSPIDCLVFNMFRTNNEIVNPKAERKSPARTSQDPIKPNICLVYVHESWKYNDVVHVVSWCCIQGHLYALTENDCNMPFLSSDTFNQLCKAARACHDFTLWIRFRQRWAMQHGQTWKGHLFKL